MGDEKPTRDEQIAKFIEARHELWLALVKAFHLEEIVGWLNTKLGGPPQTPQSWSVQAFLPATFTGSREIGYQPAFVQSEREALALKRKLLADNPPGTRVEVRQLPSGAGINYHGDPPAKDLRPPSGPISK